MRRIYTLLLLLASFALVPSVKAQIQAVNPVSGSITAAGTTAQCAPITQGNGVVDQQLNAINSSVGISVTGTWVATINVQGSVDHGKTWTTLVTPFGGNQQVVISSIGYSDVCVFAAPFTSGTANVQFATAIGSVNSAVTPAATGTGTPVMSTTNESTNGTVNTQVNTLQQVSIFNSQNVGSLPLAVENFAVDPCASGGIIKSHAHATITTATTTALVAVSGTTTVYVCEIDFEISGTTTAGTVLFEQGTGAACATSPVAQTATYTNAASTITDLFFVLGHGSNTLFATSASNGLCAVTTVGTAPSIPVDVTFVQQ